MWVSTSQPEQSQHLSIHNGYTDTGEKFSGEVVEVNGYSFKVTSADNRRVIQLQVTVPDEAFQPTITS